MKTSKTNPNPLHSDPKLSPTQGFTLMELLVVISIIGILAAILMPALSSARLKATCASCLNNEKQMELAFSMYATDNDDKIGNTGSGGGYWSMTGLATPSHWTSSDVALASVQGSLQTNNLYFQYAPNVGINHCPGDVRINNPVGAGWAYDSYAVTKNVGGGDPTQYWSKTTQITRASDCMTLVEQCDPRGYNNGTFSQIAYNGKFNFADLFATYHGNVNTFGFADGHSEFHKWSDPAILGAAKASVIAGNTNIFDYSHYGSAPSWTSADNDYLVQHNLNVRNP